MKTINLNGKWKLRPAFKDVTKDRFNEVLRIEDGDFKMFSIDGKHSAYPSKKGWMNALVPCDVIETLMQHDIIEDPVEGLGTESCQWIMDFAWWFVKDFNVDDAMLLEEKIYLYFEMIDVDAEFILNGIPVGRNTNAFAPFKEDIKRFILFGKNQLVIRLNPGFGSEMMVDSIANFGTGAYVEHPMHIYRRRPQFAEGWDWCPCIPTCGINRTAKIYGISGACIDGARVYTKSIDAKMATMGIEVCIENIRDYASADAKLSLCMKFMDKIVYEKEIDLHILGGINYSEDEFVIANPHLWWPNGCGDQPLYDVFIQVESIGMIHEFKPFKIGIRTVVIDETPIDEKERIFAVIVNGRKIFAKGGNWVPADSVYNRVTDEKYNTLISEAAAANFNMLRMWGGGLYERDAFYEICSQKGILLMHDFMYACNMYPDHDISFKYEARREAEFQIKRLRNFACLGFFTGNNENQEAITDWYDEERMPVYFPGATIFNRIQPEMVRLHAANIPYRPSSPFGGKTANSQDIGDSHIWKALGSDNGFKFKYEVEAFDRLTTKFVSEYGFFGALRKSSVIRYHKNNEIDMNSKMWIHHGERPSKTASIKKSIEYHLATITDGDIDSYLLYSGVMQGILYRELSEALRRRDTCNGNLIWMYNDCWPETGWTIIDYYMTRKISFYFQKRAYAHVHTIIRAFNEKVIITALNDSNDDVKQNIRYGLMSFSGEKRWEKVLKFKSHAFSRKIALSFNESFDKINEFVYCIIENEDGDIHTATSVRGEYRQYNLPKPECEIISITKKNNETEVIIKSQNYIPIAFLDVDDRIKMSDNFFELLPNVAKRIIIFDDLSEESIKLHSLNIEKELTAKRATEFDQG